MKIRRTDFGIDVRRLALRNGAQMDYLNRRRQVQRRRARFLARLPLVGRVRALWCAAPEVAAVRVVSDGKWRGIGR